MADGVDSSATALADALRERGAMPELLAPTDGAVRGMDGSDVAVDRAINTMASVVYDAVVVPGGEHSVAMLSGDGYAVHFVAEAVKHAEAVGALGAGTALVQRVSNGSARVAADGDGVTADRGVISASGTDGSLPPEFVDSFCSALGRHRAWERPTAAVSA